MRVAISSKSLSPSLLAAMTSLTVHTPGGGSKTFDDVDLGVTVGTFRAEVAERVGLSSFKLYATLPSGKTYLKEANDEASLSEVGVVDGGELRVCANTPWTGDKQSARRLEKGVIATRRTLKIGLREVSTSIATVAQRLDTVQATLCGEVPRRVGQSASSKLDQNLLAVRVLQTENRHLRKEVEENKVSVKLGRSAALTEAAELAQAGVHFAMADMDGVTLAEKEAAHKAQGKTLAAARRAQKAEERQLVKAANSAAAVPRGRKRKGVPSQSLLAPQAAAVAVDGAAADVAGAQEDAEAAVQKATEAAA